MARNRWADPPSACDLDRAPRIVAAWSEGLEAAEIAIREQMTTGSMEQLIRRLRRHGHDLPRRKRPRPLVVPAERNLDADRYLTTSGYVRVRSARKDEHVLVMEAVLGRELLPGETVHHRNAVRNDNRPENLQLRVRGRHPRGASVEDLLAWAREVVELYGPLELALA